MSRQVRKKRVINTNKIVVLIALFIVLIALVYTAYTETKPAETTLGYLEFIESIENGEVDKVNIIDTEETFNVYMKDGEVYTVTNPDNEDFKKELLEKGVTIETSSRTAEDAIISVILVLPSTILMILFGLFIYKQLNGTANTMFKVLKNEEQVTFKDVAGIDDIRDEVEFAVETLKNYKELYKSGARPTKGIILEGPPGTGKTLIAKAIAGEAKVPFISVSGSDFVELFVGMGASRVRSLWEVARANAPCVIFIDEIDAIGRKRGTGLGSGNTEYNQTVNALLQRMDGLAGDSGILVIGATNMVDDLDPALIRPGRFDKKIHVGTPKTKESRDEIIRVHLRNKQLEEGIDFDKISKLMFSLSGAEIESSLNEAVMISIRANRKGIIGIQDIDEAVMKLRVNGVIVNSITERDKYISAVHEAGHAIISSLLGKRVAKISIIAYSSGVGGVTIPDIDDELGQFKMCSEIEQEVQILLGGMVAERIIFGENSFGCSNDLERATILTKQMIYSWGMYKNNIVSLKGYNSDNSISISNEKMVEEVNNIGIELYNKTYKILIENKEEIEKLANRLMDEETILDYKL